MQVAENNIFPNISDVKRSANFFFGVTAGGRRGAIGA